MFSPQSLHQFPPSILLPTSGAPVPSKVDSAPHLQTFSSSLTQKNLIVFTKCFQQLGNGILFGKKEQKMIVFNKWLTKSIPLRDQLLTELIALDSSSSSSSSSDQPPPSISHYLFDSSTESDTSSSTHFSNFPPLSQGTTFSAFLALRPHLHRNKSSILHLLKHSFVDPTPITPRKLSPQLSSDLANQSLSRRRFQTDSTERDFHDCIVNLPPPTYINESGLSEEMKHSVPTSFYSHIIIPIIFFLHFISLC